MTRQQDHVTPVRDGVPDVYITVDVEPDCPPYMWTWRGMEEGMPRLLQLLDTEKVPVTLFDRRGGGALRGTRRFHRAARA